MKVDTCQFSMYLLFYAKISIKELKLINGIGAFIAV